MGIAFFCLCHSAAFHAQDNIPRTGSAKLPDEFDIRTDPKVSHDDLLTRVMKLRSMIHHKPGVLPELLQIF